MESLLAGFGVAAFFGFILELLPSSLLEKFDNVIEVIYIGIQIILPLFFAIVYTMIWQRQQQKPEMEEVNLKRHSVLRAIARYWLAFSIASYGFAKILRTQFQESVTTRDELVGSLNGFQLTWNYFSYSYTFAVILGVIQILGSILLLFRRTTLLGCLILIPVMLNILLINLFYDIAFGAFVNSVLFTLGLCYLFFLYWPDIREILFKPVPGTVPSKKPWLSYTLRFLVVGAAFGFIYYFVYNMKETRLKGKWKVARLVRNHQEVDRSKWESDSTAWNNIYFDSFNRVVFCSNPYVLEKKRATYARLEEKEKDLTFILWNKKKDTIRANIQKESGNTLLLTAFVQQDTLELELEKLKN